MKQSKRKAFTLIELVGVLVIMAIIALIATPLVMSIIRKARISADKRSIDAYGRSIELAIAGYLMDTGNFPTSIEQLIIEYSGDEVVCTTTQLNSDSSVYLADCTVAGRSVDEYTYGKYEAPTYAAYQIGDEVNYNNVDYYVIKDSSASEESVTLLKAKPLTAEEIATYSSGTGAQTDGNGGMQYGETSAYSTSYVKQTVDDWMDVNASEAIEARLITMYEYESMTTVETYETPSAPKVITTPMYDWQYNNGYWYWTMNPLEDSTSSVLVVNHSGKLDNTNISNSNSHGFSCTVRPIIVLPKSAL